MLTACSAPAPAPGVQRVALLTVENLTGDPSLDWISRAIPRIAENQLTGSRLIVPMAVDSTRDAANVSANLLVHGYFDKRPGLHFSFQIEDSATHSMRPLNAEGEALRVADAVAKALDPAAREFTSRNPEAIQAWAMRDFARATQIDPSFGAAWRDWLQSAPSPELAARASGQTDLRGEIEKEQIRLVGAQARRDGPALVESGMKLAKLLPNEGSLLGRLGEQAYNARLFRESVQLYQTQIEAKPDDKTPYNMLGYSQFFAGDLEAARRSFAEYGKESSQTANALDSEGEVLFMAGRFKDAEDYFLRAHKTSPGLLDGGDLVKAAYARWLSGDVAGAEEIFQSYLKFSTNPAEKQKQQAAWAMAKTASMPRTPGPDKLPELKLAYEKSRPGSDGLIRTLYARALLMAGRKAEAAQVAELWPLPDLDRPVEGAVLYPVYRELKKELSK